MDKLDTSQQLSIEKRLALFAEFNPHPIIGLDFLGEIIFVNFAARTQFPTITSVKISHPILQAIGQELKSIAPNGKELTVFSREINFFNKVYEQQIFVIPDKETIFIYMNDVTEKKKFEDEIRSVNASLEKRVLQRTKELRTSKEMAELLAIKAEEASRAKSNFLTMMSHELRTPLNGLFGMTTLLLDTPLTEEQQEMAKTIQLSGNMLLTIINDIFDFSKLENGAHHLEVEVFNIRNLISEVITFAADNIKNSIELKANVSDEIPENVTGDLGKLHQVLTNLLNNAAKFTEKGFITLNVKLSGAATTNKPLEILFEIIDTGIGMAPEIQDKLFEPFAPGDTSVTRKYGGKGLGLAITKALIELMQGSLAVKSKLGQGSEFSFVIPLLPA